MRYFNPGFTIHPPLVVLWNSLDKTSNILLSNGLKTATGNGAGEGGVRATLVRTAGKYYFELNFTSIANSDTGGGLASSDAVLATVGATPLKAILQFKSGNVYNNNGLVFSNGNMTGGGILRVAYDASNHKVWLAFGAGTWNANPANDPATAVGGQTVSGFDSGGLYPCFSCGTTGDECIANFGASTFSYGVPTTYSAWNAA